MKRFLSLLLAIVMIMTMLPQVSVFASEEQTETTVTPVAPEVSEQALPDDVTVEQTELDTVYRYSIVPADHALYTIYTAGDLDTEGSVYDAEGNCLATDTDSGDYGNCRLCVYLKKGETYTFELKSHGIGALDLRSAWTPVAPVKVGGQMNNFVPVGEMVYVPFTAEEDGIYSFTSKCSMDTYGYLYSVDMKELQSNDDGTEDNNFLLSHAMKAGETVVIGARFYDQSNSGMLTVLAKASSLKSVSVRPLILPELCAGYFTSGSEEDRYFRYAWQDYMTYDITLRDGSVQTFTGRDFTLDGMTLSCETEDEQSYVAPWTVGNTYTAKAFFAGIEAPVEITIAESPVASVTVEPMSFIQHTGGYYEQSRDPSTGERLWHQYHYHWDEKLSYTVRFKDGTAGKFSGSSFEYNGQVYYIVVEHEDDESDWGIGVHNPEFYVLGYKATADVSITESPVESIVAKPVVLGVNSNRVSDSVYIDGQYTEYTYYNYHGLVNFTVTLKDGTVVEINGGDGYVDDVYYSLNIRDNQSAKNAWGLGVHEATAEFMGYTFPVPVEITDAMITGLEIDPITMTENTTGIWMEGEQGSYFRYNWWENMRFRVTMADGGIAENTGTYFEYGGEYYTASYNDPQSAENTWVAGNTYNVDVTFAGVTVTVPVTIAESPISAIVFQPLSIVENTCGNEDAGNYYYYWWDRLSYTVYLKNGESFNGSGSGFGYNGQYFQLRHKDDQNDAPWVAGNTYTGFVSVSGYETSVAITIEKNPIQSIEIDPIVLLQETQGFWDSYYYYQWWNALTYTVTFTDGTVLPVSGLRFNHNGQEYEFNTGDNQGYESPWLPGNQYEAYVTLGSVTYTVPVAIRQAEVVNIVARPLSIPAGSHGTLQRGDGRDVWFVYEWWKYITYTVYFADGATMEVTGDTFTYNGVPYTIEGVDDQENVAWQAGSTHDVAISVPGCGVSATVSISAAEAGGTTFPAFQPDVDNMVEITQPGQLQVFSFVPQESGVYIFASYGNQDTYGYLLDDAFNQLMANDDGNGNLQFRVEGQLEAGRTYYIVASFLSEGSVGSYPVRMTRGLGIENIVFQPVTMYLGSGGGHISEGPGSPSYYRYYWWEQLSYAVTFSNGDVIYVGGSSFGYDGIHYSLSFEDSQSAEAPWGVGTYEAYVTVAGNRYPVAVTVEDTNIAQVTLHPVTVLENGTGYYNTRWNPETQQEEPFFQYYWWNNIPYEITFKNGDSNSGSGSGFYYDGRYTNFDWQDDNQFDDPWQAGGTYTCYVNIAGVNYPVAVFVKPVRVESVTVSPVMMMEHMEGSWDSSFSGEFFRYYWWDRMQWTVTFTDGNSINGVGTTGYYQGSWFNITYTDDQCYENAYVTGGSYPNTVNILGKEAQVQVSVTNTAGGSAGENAVWTLDGDGNFVVSGFGELYQYHGSDEMEWVRYRDRIRTVTISEGITDLGTFAFYRCSNLETVTIADSVMHMGDFSFYSCVNLRSITFGSNVATIGHNCFAYCTNLREVTLPASLQSLGDWAFYPCSDLLTVYYLGTPKAWERVEYLGHVGFDRYFVTCLGVAEVVEEGTCGDLQWTLNSDGVLTFTGEGVIPDYTGAEETPWFAFGERITEIFVDSENVSIGNYAFAQLKNLQNVNYVGAIERIGAHAFEDCSSLSCFNLTRVNAVDSYAFANCKEMAYVMITPNRLAVADYAFDGAGVCEVEYGGPGYQFYQENFGIGNDVLWDAYLYSVEDEGTIRSGRCGEKAYWRLDETGELSVFGEGAIFDYDFREQPWNEIGYPVLAITIEDGITAIGSQAFARCGNVRDLTIPGSVEYIGENAFYNLANCTVVNIPEGVEFIDNGAFAFSGMMELNLPDSLLYIGEEAFRACDSLPEVTIPMNVNEIGVCAFTGCHALNAIWVDAENANFSSDEIGVLYNKDQTVLLSAPTRLEGSFTVPETVERIAPYAFAYCTNLSEVVMGDNVTEIGAYAFTGCYGLSSVTLSNTLTYLAEGVFMEAGLHTFDIPSGVTAIGANAFQGCEYLTKVTIPETVTEINSYAFAYCRVLTEATIPATVTYVGEYAFYQCDMLSQITVPEGVTEIGSFAFADCLALDRITIPSTVETIGAYAFIGCTNLTEVTMSDNVTAIGDSAFEGCVALESVKLPAGVTELVYRMFAGCTALENITIPENVQSIGDQAFADCNALTEITVPDSVESVGDYAFKQCENLSVVNIGKGVAHIGANVFADSLQISAIRVHSENAVYRSDEYGALYEGNMLLRCPPKLQGEFVIPEGIEEIAFGAFTGCQEMTAVTVPGSVTVLGPSTFDFCTGLTAIHLNEGLQSIEELAFAFCTSLEEMVIPDTVSWVGYDAFRDCYNLRSVTLPESMEELQPSVFAGCWNLTTVIIPKNVRAILNNAFAGCSVSEVYYGGTRAQWMNVDIYEGNGCLYSANIIYAGDNEIIDSGICGENVQWTLTSGGKLTIFGEGVMDVYDEYDAPWYPYSTDIRTLEVQDGVQFIGSYAFRDCYNLTDAFISGSVQEIAFNAFIGCVSLQNVTLCEGIVSIGRGAFAGAIALQEVILPDTLEFIGQRAFSGCTSLQQMVIPASVSVIEGGVFYDCSNLQAIFVDPANSHYMSDSFGVLYNKDTTVLLQAPGGISGAYTVLSATQEIRDEAFAGCNGLTEITIPESVVSIGDNAFLDCHNLQDVYYDGSDVAWGKITIGYNNECMENASRHYGKVANIGEGTFGEEISWVLDPDGTLTISGGAMPTDLDSVWDVPWYQYADRILAVQVMEGVTNIGDYAFYGCENARTLTLPASVVEIGTCAFQRCHSLTDVEIPAGVQTIRESAFEDCANLVNVFTTGNLQVIQNRAFTNCPSLQSFSFQYGLTMVGDEAFAGTNLSYVDLPATMQYLGARAFENCFGINNVTVEESAITEIYDRTFANCVNLQYVTLGNSIQALGEEVFYGCGRMESVVMSDNIARIGANAFAQCGTLLAITIPQSVTEISDNAFYNCSNLTYVTMGDVLTVGSYAFYNTALMELHLPDSVRTVGVGAFASCGNLHTVTLGSSLENLGSNAFENCGSLTTITLPDGLSVLEYNTFAHCGNLQQVNIGTNLTYISDNAFMNCYSITDVFYAGNITQWSDIVVESGNEFLLNATITFGEEPENVYYCPHCNNEVEFADWTGNTESSGHYRLMNDFYGEHAMVGTSNITGTDIVLDLNGYGLYTAKRAFTVYKENSLTVLDTAGGGVIRGGSSSVIGGAVLVSGGTFRLVNGTLTSMSNNSGGCVYVTNSGSFYMENGQLIGGILSAGRRGGALYVADGSHATLLGGLITNGAARGASIYVADAGNLQLGTVTVGELVAAHDAYIYLCGSPVVETMDLYSGARLDFDTLDRNTRITVYADGAFTYSGENRERYISYFCPGYTDAAIVVENGEMKMVFPDEHEIADVTVMEMPFKWQYEQGEELDITGLQLLVYYADGSEEVTEEGFVCYGFDSETPGVKRVYVAYGDFTTSFNVVVNEKRITDVYLHAFPYKTEYFVGEYLDTYGLELQVTYSNGELEYIADGYTLDTGLLSEAGVHTVNVTYGDFTVSFQVSVRYRQIELISQPENVLIQEGETAQFHVGANHVAAYRWEINRNDGKGWCITDLFGRPEYDTLAVPAELTYSGYTFRCVLTGADGKTVYTDEVTLTVIPNVIYVTELRLEQLPEKLTYNEGEELTLAGMKLMASYNYGEDQRITEGYTVSGFDTAVAGEQVITVTYEGASVTFTVTVVAAGGEIVEQPVDVNVDSGETVTFTVGVEGNVTAYQWQLNSGDGNWVNATMSSANSATLSLTAIGVRHNFRFRCVVTFANGEVKTSDSAKLTVNTVITITDDPNDQVVVLGHKGQFTVAATGEGLTYQWQYCRPGTSKWIDTAMEGAKKPTVYIETTKARDGYKYRCRVTDNTGNVAYSEAATMTVLAFVSQPKDAYAPINGTAQFKVTASAESGFTYQWQYRRNASASWTNTTMTGYNTDTLTVAATKTRNGYQYRCVLTGARNGKLESKAATLHVSGPVSITSQPQSVTVSSSANAVFTVEATNVLSYQWYFKRPTGDAWMTTTAAGNTTATLTVAAKGKNGYQYQCRMIGMDGQEYVTDIADLTIG